MDILDDEVMVMLQWFTAHLRTPLGLSARDAGMGSSPLASNTPLDLSARDACMGSSPQASIIPLDLSARGDRMVPVDL